MWTTFGMRETPFYAALVALFMGIYWGVECALLSGRLIIDGPIAKHKNIASHDRNGARPAAENVEKTSLERAGLDL